MKTRNEPIRRSLPFTVYVTGGVLLALQFLSSGMAQIYGAPPTWPMETAALMASFILIGAAFVGLGAEQAGRRLCIGTILLLGMYFIPASTSIAPIHGMSLNLQSWIIILGYLALLAFSLFYPTTLKYSAAVMIAVVMASAGFAFSAYQERLEAGEYAWPETVYYTLDRGDDGLIVEDDPQSYITEEILRTLKNAHVSGKLKWTHTTSYRDTGHRMFVISTGAIESEKKLYHPKQKHIIYLHDAGKWISLPVDAAVYEKYPAIIRTDGSVSQRIPRRGTSGTIPFYWKSPAS